MCNHDCLNCTKADCDAKDIKGDRTLYSVEMNATWCKTWYEKNKEKKRAYQREYARQRRAMLKAQKELVMA